jgi:hypothetical protein
MIRSDTYFMEPQTYGNYARAKKRKIKLKGEGWRVKIAKGPAGEYQVFKKHVQLMDQQQGKGNGRVRI